MTGERRSPVPVTQLSPLAQLFLARPLAELRRDARTGRPELLRVKAARYLETAQELDRTGHPAAALELKVCAAMAMRAASLIERGLKAPQRPDFLQLVSEGAPA